MFIATKESLIMNQMLSLLVFLLFFEGLKIVQDMFSSLNMMKNIDSVIKRLAQKSDALVFACTRVPVSSVCSRTLYCC